MRTILTTKRRYFWCTTRATPECGGRITPTDTDAPVFLVSSRSLAVCTSCARDNWNSGPNPSSREVLKCNATSSPNHGLEGSRTVPRLRFVPGVVQSSVGVGHQHQEQEWNSAPALQGSDTHNAADWSIAVKGQCGRCWSNRLLELHVLPALPSHHPTRTCCSADCCRQRQFFFATCHQVYAHWCCLHVHCFPSHVLSTGISGWAVGAAQPQLGSPWLLHQGNTYDAAAVVTCLVVTELLAPSLIHPVSTFKTFSCVRAPRAHVFQHVRVVPEHTETF